MSAIAIISTSDASLEGNILFDEGANTGIGNQVESQTMQQREHIVGFIWIKFSHLQKPTCGHH